MEPSARTGVAGAGDAAPRRGALVAGCLALALLAVAPSVGTLGASWISDDTAILGRVHRVGASGDWTGSQYGLGLVRFWRPVTTTSWALQEAWTGVSPLPLRLANLLNHVLCALLAAGIVRRLGGRGAAALLAGALVALFPHQGGTVTWIAGRVDSLGAFFLMIAAWTALGPRPALAALPAFLGCATKEIAFVVAVWVPVLLWAQGFGPRAVLRRAWPTLLAVAVALVWRRLALGTWVGGYPGAGLDAAALWRAALTAGQGSGTLLALAVLALVVGRLAGAASGRLWLAGLVCAVTAVLPLVPMLAQGGLEPQNQRWLFVAEMGLALSVAAGCAGTARRAAPAALVLVLGALVAGMRAREAWRDTHDWAASAALADARTEAARRSVADEAPSSRPVLSTRFPTGHAGAYCMGFGVADRFRAPFEVSPRPVWPHRPLFGFETSVRLPVQPPRADGTVWPWSDPPRAGLLRVTDEVGELLTALPLDERAVRAPEDHSPRMRIHGAFPGDSFELVVYTEMGYEPAAWLAAGDAEVRTLSLMQALVASNGHVSVAQALLQSADLGATRAYLEIRVVDARGAVLAAAPWIELAWDPALVAAVR